MPHGRGKPAPFAGPTNASASPSLPPPPPASSPRPPSLALTLTIRHLPSDRWQSFSVPREWRVEQVKAAALASFAAPVAERPASASARRSTASSSSAHPLFESETPAPSVTRTATATSGRSKENEEVARADSEAVKAQRASEGSSGGMRAVARATSSMANKLCPFPTRSPRSLRFAHDSARRPPVPSFPPRHDYDTLGSAPSSSSRPSLSLDLPSSSSSSIPSLASASRPTAPFASSSFVDDDDVCTPTASRSHERLPEVNPQTPSHVLWPEYGTKRVERGRRSHSSKLLSLGRKGKAAKKGEELEPDGWCLVKAVTGSFTSDQRIVGSTFVEQDLLILKPRLLAFDPPLHLLHLPYLRLSRIELLTSPVADLAVDPSSPTTPKRSKRRSWGSAPKSEPLFVDRGETLQQSHPLPASNIRLVIVEPSLADYFPDDKTPSSRQRPSLSLPIIALDFDDGDHVAFRPTSRVDLDSLLDLLGDEDEESELLCEGEMERRKNTPPPSSPIIPLSPSQPISRRRSLNSPPSSRRAHLAKSTTQLVLSRVPSVDEQLHPAHHSSSSGTSAESLVGGSGASGVATAPTSPALRPPSAAHSGATGPLTSGRASTLVPPVPPPRSALRPRSSMSRRTTDEGEKGSST
ncbi:hypothetical protein JCM8208_001480 [Rhodotorula glutinis]